MASRRKGRIVAFQTLYAWDISGNLPYSSALGGNYSADNLPAGSSGRENDFVDMPDFSRLLVSGTIENIKPIDAMIRRHLENWDFSRLNRVDLAVLRMSVYTLMFQTDLSPSIIIDEAIGISKEFGTDDSYRFVNGVLDSIRLTLQKAEKACPPEN